MGSVTIQEALAIEASAMANGWTGEQLLNAAGESLGHSIARLCPTPGTIVGYLGKGHNAGDALVALRILRDCHGWKIAVRSAFPIDTWAPLTRKKWNELGIMRPLDRPPFSPGMGHPHILLDALLGSGAKGPLREPLVALAREMAHLRNHSGARVAAVDLPTGIDPDSGKIHPDTVIADVTFMIGNAKRGLLQAHAANATGALALVPVKPLESRVPSDIELISPQTMAFGKSPRPFDFHKGMAGRVAIVAGSANYTGAAVLAASGALRGGAGLVTLFVPAAITATVNGKCPPEVIVRGYQDVREVPDTRFDSLVVGCGLGKADDLLASGILELIAGTPAPVVIDADALNLIAEKKRFDLFAENHVLTPHPGEFARLAPDLSEFPREKSARQFANRYPATLLLKGSRTIVTRSGAPLWCNSTGSPGMASGGHGDVLAGVIGALLAIGHPPTDAAALGAWLCGRGAEIALNARPISEESLLPGDALDFLGAAFRDWRTGSR